MTDDGKPEWDAELAAALEGSFVLVGLTHVEGDATRLEQIYGTVEAATREGIRIALDGARSGETYTLPPDTSSFEPADPGEYRLRSTGEVVVNPDYFASWTITARARN